MPFPNFFRAAAHITPALPNVSQENVSMLLNSTAAIISNKSAIVVISILACFCCVLKTCGDSDTMRDDVCCGGRPMGAG